MLVDAGEVSPTGKGKGGEEDGSKANNSNMIEDDVTESDMVTENKGRGSRPKLPDS